MGDFPSMHRIPEPELMDDPAQAKAYAEADFSEPHSMFVEEFRRVFPDLRVHGHFLDLGCGPADVTVRFARAFPRCVVDGVDGAEAMLRQGRERIHREALGGRIHLIQCRLPGCEGLRARYDGILSNSLLHHLRDPLVLWRTVMAHARPGAPIFVMELLRPASKQQATDLVDQYAGDEPLVLKEDFYNSLLAAYRPDEVERQLEEIGLSQLKVEGVSDRHFIVFGTLTP